MSVSAVSSALHGLQAAQAQMDGSAAAAAGGGDPTSAITGAVDANVQADVNIAMLRAAMDQEKSVISILA